MVITPLLETADEGVVVVAVSKTQLYSTLIDQVVNEWNTAGPEGGASQVFDVLFCYHEYFSASSGVPSEGYAGFPTAVDTIATINIFRRHYVQRVLERHDDRIREKLQHAKRGLDFCRMLSECEHNEAQTFHLADLKSTVGCTIERGGWFGLYSTVIAISIS